MSEIEKNESQEKEDDEKTSENDHNCIRVLDQGFVRLVDVMGNDSSIVQSARVSYGKGTKSVRADQALIFYLMQHKHTTPFEMVEFKFHCRMPIYVARQWIRHRTANVNEISGRYSVMEDRFWVPKPEDFRTQAETNRQGEQDASPLPRAIAEKLLETFKKEQRLLYQNYESYLAAGVAREIARTNLPLSLYTEWYWKIDLHNLLHFLHLRLDAHAQKEIRVFAEAMAHFVKQNNPIAWGAFEEHGLHASHLSCKERNLIAGVIEEKGLWEEIKKRRVAQLKEEGASPVRLEREISDLKRRLIQS